MSDCRLLMAASVTSQRRTASSGRRPPLGPAGGVFPLLQSFRRAHDCSGKRPLPVGRGSVCVRVCPSTAVRPNELIANIEFSFS